MTEKRVLVAHPLSEDVGSNLPKIIEICENLLAQSITPVAPSLLYLDDQQRASLGQRIIIENPWQFIDPPFFDELWLFGSEIGAEMEEEILNALNFKLPILPRTIATANHLAVMLNELNEWLDEEHGLFCAYDWKQARAPVVPPKWVVGELKKTRRPVEWRNGGNREWDESIKDEKRNWLMLYYTEFDGTEIVTRLLPGSVQPAEGWLSC